MCVNQLGDRQQIKFLLTQFYLVLFGLFGSKLKEKKMNKRLIGSVLLAMLLVACASKPMKEPAKVEDKSPVSQPAKPADDGAATKGVTDAGMEGKSNLSPLKDPNNILSKRTVYFDFDSD